GRGLRDGRERRRRRGVDGQRRGELGARGRLTLLRQTGGRYQLAVGFLLRRSRLLGLGGEVWRLGHGSTLGPTAETLLRQGGEVVVVSEFVIEPKCQASGRDLASGLVEKETDEESAERVMRPPARGRPS